MSPIVPDRPANNARVAPRLALVIGSGGVRGIAALGIFDVLAGEGFKPDVLVGCSSGAVFGAAIALGLPAKETLGLATSLWTRDLTEQKRWWGYLQLIAPRLARFGPDFSLRDGRPIRAALERAFGERDLQDLPLPMRVSVTDSASGLPVVLTRGRVTDAVAASLAVPFLFPSVVIDGWRFVDGVISDPLPIAAAADAQLVIAIGFKGALPRRVDRPARLAALASTALINNLQHARTAAARSAGRALLELELALDRRVGLWQTSAMPYLFEAGRRLAIAHLPEIARLVEQTREPPHKQTHAQPRRERAA